MKLCNRCSKAARIIGSHYCQPCRSICTKCQERQNTGTSRWCLQCKAAYMRATRKGKPVPEQARKKDILRSYAHVMVKRGKIARENCAVCGDAKTFIRFSIYELPLQIRWLCKTHHREDQLNARALAGAAAAPAVSSEHKSGEPGDPGPDRDAS